MNIHFLNLNHLLLSLFFVVSSCNGQVQTDLPQDITHHLSPIDNDQPKIVLRQGVASGSIICQLQDRNGMLWFSTSGEGVYRYDGRSFTNFTTKDGLCSNDVNSIIEDKAGNILVGTKSGICKYDGKTFSTYSKHDDPTKKPISSLLEDREGNLWFGTWGDGVYRYDPSASLREGGKIFTNFLNKDVFVKNATSILDNNEPRLNLGETNQLILDILQDKNGNLWFSSWNGGGVWRYDPSASLMSGETSFKNYLPSAEYYLRNEDGRSPNKPIEPAIFNNSSQDHISDDMIFSISEDKAGNLWFATRRHGACRYDGKSFVSFRENEGFVSSGIYSIVEDKKGNIWLTSEDNGVWCYDPSTSLGAGGNSFKNYSTADGLVNNSVFSVLEDKDGNLWFGTRQFGLSRFDPSSLVTAGGKAFTTFSEYKEN